MIIGPGNYEVIYTDVDGRPKKVILYMAEEHIDVLHNSQFRVITGWEKRGTKSITKMIILGQNHAATLDLAA